MAENSKFEILEEYDFTVSYYSRGKDHVLANALSRIRIDLEELKRLSKTDVDVNVLTRAQTMRKGMAHKSESFPSKLQDIRLDHPGVVELMKIHPTA